MYKNAPGSTHNMYNKCKKQPIQFFYAYLYKDLIKKLISIVTITDKSSIVTASILVSYRGGGAPSEIRLAHLVQVRAVRRSENKLIIN